LSGRKQTHAYYKHVHDTSENAIWLWQALVEEQGPQRDVPWSGLSMEWEKDEEDRKRQRTKREKGSRDLTV